MLQRDDAQHLDDKLILSRYPVGYEYLQLKINIICGTQRLSDGPRVNSGLQEVDVRAVDSAESGEVRGRSSASRNVGVG